MHPELFTLPFGLTVKTYGFFLMIGFLSAVWLSMRRAERVKADPDAILNASFLALIFGVLGARLFYVMHYWDRDFADMPNAFLAVINITKGGLEFLGGFLGATLAIIIYLMIPKRISSDSKERRPLSIRLYLDILAPAVMWGLAFGRLGCFFNGCCFGGVCATDDTQAARYPWAMSFPYGSPAAIRQWEQREISFPAELIITSPTAPRPNILPASVLSMSVEERESPQRKVQASQKALDEAKSKDPQSEDTKRLEQQLTAAVKARDAHAKDHFLKALETQQRYPSREVPTRNTSVSELQALAAASASRPLHPTQLYSSINAMLLSAFFSAMFYVRKRHGVVAASVFVLYPITRFIMELIRTDNPQDTLGLTISQFVSMVMFVFGLAALFVIYKYLPERSPNAVPYVPPPEE